MNYIFFTLLVIAECFSDPEVARKSPKLSANHEFGKHLLAYSNNPHKDLTISEIQNSYLEKYGKELSYQDAIQTRPGKFVHPAEKLFPYGIPYGEDFAVAVKGQPEVLRARVITELDERERETGTEAPDTQHHSGSNSFVDPEYAEYLRKIPLTYKEFLQNFEEPEVVPRKNESDVSKWDYDENGEWDHKRAAYNRYVRNFKTAIVESRDERLEEAMEDEKTKTVFRFSLRNGRILELPYVDKETDVPHANFFFFFYPEKGDTKILYSIFGQPVAAVRKKSFSIFA